MEAVILAGGFGTRLKSAVKDVPKPMVEINGKPFLVYLMDYLFLYSISKAILSVGYKHEVIERYFGPRYKGIDIKYVIEKEPLGTGGAIKEALKCVTESHVFVLNGDTFFDVNLKELLDFHYKEGSDVTLTVKPMHNFDRYGAVRLAGNEVTGFEEKAFRTSGYVNGGIYVVQKGILKDFEQKSFSFESDFLEKKTYFIQIRAFISDGYFIDIGIPGDYSRAQSELPTVFKGISV